jgi:LPS export ABC transporter permease LptG/LPS export ABC transporter permease LptF
MRILTRYILREILSHALLGGALFTFVLFTRDLGHLLELIVRNSSSAGSVLKIFLYMLPNMFTVTIPMSVLVGVLLGLSRLAADSEITAMRASGIGVWSLVRIASLVAVTAWGVGLVNTLYLAPHAWSAMLSLEDDLKNSQASFEVQPRVFYEDFKNMVLYVDDVRASTGAAQWRKVFLADVTNPAAPRVTTAEEATVVNSGQDSVTMRLRNGTEHQLEAANPNQYDVSTFAETDLPLVSSNDEDTHAGHSASPVLALSNHELRAREQGPNGRWYQIELGKRYSYPAACFVLMLVGVPLGMSSRRGGKSAGFVLTIALVFVYYFLSSTGVALARQNKISVVLGVWGANLIFGGFGLLMLQRLGRAGGALPSLPALTALFRTLHPGSEPRPFSGLVAEPYLAANIAKRRAPRERHTRSHFPLILDEYVIREFLKTFVLVLVTFVMLMLLFTFFELLGDIIRNRTALITVGAYLANLTPSMIYTIAPLSVLIAVLVVFGGLNRSNELTAMKATGISVYRIVLPILAISSILAVALFSFDELYVPHANRRQEALRSIIKGRPAQTYERPEQKWMFGLEKQGVPSHIFYYQFFDPDKDSFANISVFEFQPGSFALARRLFATSAHWEPNLHTWVFENGWQREFAGDEVKSYSTFQVATLDQVHEPPQYFKKETRQSSEMSFAELSRYITGLRQSGFDTMRLRVQLNHKLAYPLITLVMAMLAVPFALSMGRSGSLAGIAVAIGVAIVYWVVAGTFEAMGDVNMLPALLAAWSPDLLFGLAGTYLLLRTPT